MTNKTQEAQVAADTSMSGAQIKAALAREDAQARAVKSERDEAARVAKEKAITEFPARMRRKVQLGGLGLFFLGAAGVFVGVFSLGAGLASAFVIAPVSLMALSTFIMLAPGLTMKAFQAFDDLCDRIMCKKQESAEGVELTRYPRVGSAVEERQSLMGGHRSTGSSYGATAATPKPKAGSLGLFSAVVPQALAEERVGLLLLGDASSNNPSNGAVDSTAELTLTRSRSANRKV